MNIFLILLALINVCAFLVCLFIDRHKLIDIALHLSVFSIGAVVGVIAAITLIW